MDQAPSKMEFNKNTQRSEEIIKITGKKESIKANHLSFKERNSSNIMLFQNRRGKERYKPKYLPLLIKRTRNSHLRGKRKAHL